MIEPERLAALLEPASPAISLYVPLDPEQRDLRAPVAELRRMAETVDGLLERQGIEAARRERLLAPLRAVGDNELAEHRDPGLAFFLSDGVMQTVRLPEMLPELLVVSGHFHIKPLLPLLARFRRFHILALSSTRARLLTATPFAWEERPLHALPAEVQAELDSRSAAAIEHAAETRMALLTQSPNRIAFAVRAELGADPAAIVLAAEPQVAGHFRKGAQLAGIMPETVAVNPFALPDAELHARALAVISPSLAQETETLLEQIEARLGTAEPTVAIRLEEIIAAAREGRVDAVIVASDETLWGRDVPGQTIDAHGHAVAGDEDLINLAAVEVLRTGGRACALPRAHLPRHVPAAATLRF